MVEFFKHRPIGLPHPNRQCYPELASPPANTSCTWSGFIDKSELFISASVVIYPTESVAEQQFVTSEHDAPARTKTPLGDASTTGHVAYYPPVVWPVEKAVLPGTAVAVRVRNAIITADWDGAAVRKGTSPVEPLIRRGYASATSYAYAYGMAKALIATLPYPT